MRNFKNTFLHNTSRRLLLEQTQIFLSLDKTVFGSESNDTRSDMVFPSSQLPLKCFRKKTELDIIMTKNKINYTKCTIYSLRVLVDLVVHWCLLAPWDLSDQLDLGVLVDLVDLVVLLLHLNHYLLFHPLFHRNQRLLFHQVLHDHPNNKVQTHKSFE